MKKVKFDGKLSLNKETIAKLNDDQMNAVQGGATVDFTCRGDSCGATCAGCCSYTNTLHCTGTMC